MIINDDPQVIGPYLTGFRKTYKELKGNVWIKNGLDGREHSWLRNVDSAPVFLQTNIRE